MGDHLFRDTPATAVTYLGERLPQYRHTAKHCIQFRISGTSRRLGIGSTPDGEVLAPPSFALHLSASMLSLSSSAISTKSPIWIFATSLAGIGGSHSPSMNGGAVLLEPDNLGCIPVKPVVTVLLPPAASQVGSEPNTGRFSLSTLPLPLSAETQDDTPYLQDTHRCTNRFAIGQPHVTTSE